MQRPAETVDPKWFGTLLMLQDEKRLGDAGLREEHHRVTSAADANVGPDRGCGQSVAGS